MHRYHIHVNLDFTFEWNLADKFLLVSPKKGDLAMIFRI
jgi:hypothetical protein